MGKIVGFDLGMGERTSADRTCPKLWLMRFFVVFSSIWIMRNDIIFNSGQPDIEKLMDLMRWRLELWSKAWWPEILVFAEDVYCCPELAKVPACPPKLRKPTAWHPPLSNVVKFNTDGSSLGQPGPAGIGDIPVHCTSSVTRPTSLNGSVSRLVHPGEYVQLLHRSKT